MGNNPSGKLVSAQAAPGDKTGKAWLLRLVLETASGASQLRYFLADPEVASLLAEASKLRGILRPLCHMLGIRPPETLPAQAALPLPPPGAALPMSCISSHAPPPATSAALPPITLPPWKPPPSPSAPHTFAPRILA